MTKTPNSYKKFSRAFEHEGVQYRIELSTSRDVALVIRARRNEIASSVPVAILEKVAESEPLIAAALTSEEELLSDIRAASASE